MSVIIRSVTRSPRKPKISPGAVTIGSAVIHFNPSGETRIVFQNGNDVAITPDYRDMALYATANAFGYGWQAGLYIRDRSIAIVAIEDQDGGHKSAERFMFDMVNHGARADRIVQHLSRGGHPKDLGDDSIAGMMVAQVVRGGGHYA